VAVAGPRNPEGLIGAAQPVFHHDDVADPAERMEASADVILETQGEGFKTSVRLTLEAKMV
jgi:hypothetical protein